MASSDSNLQTMEQRLINGLNDLVSNIDFDISKGALLALLYLKYVNDTEETACNNGYKIIIPNSAKWSTLQNSRHKNQNILVEAFRDIDRYNPDLHGLFKGVMSFFESPQGMKNDPWHPLSLFDFISEYDLNDLDSYFGDFFDKILLQITKHAGKISGYYFQPPELTAIMNSFSPEKENLSIYNPFAGVASLSLELPKGTKYYGQELHREIWSIGRLRMLAHNCPVEFKFECQDSIESWLPDNINRKFDFIVGTPPFGVRIEKAALPLIKTEQRFVDSFFIEQAINSLSDKGQAIIVVPQSVLTDRGARRRLRSELITKDMLEMIISFPSGLLVNTALAFALIVINNNKKDKGKVRFVDTGSYNSDLTKKVKYDMINNIIAKANNNEESEYIQVVSNETIKAFDFNLRSLLYFHKNVEGTPLNELVSVIKGHSNFSEKLGQLVRISNLKEDNLDYTINHTKEDIHKLPGHIRKIEESCLLLATRWRAVKPTYFEYTGKPI